MTSSSLPPRSLEQRRAALREGNRIRTYRAELKKDLKAGRVRIDHVLEDPPAELLTAHVIDVVRHVPQVGRVKALKALREANVSPSKTIGGLSQRQRTELASILAYPTERARREALAGGGRFITTHRHVNTEESLAA